MLPEPISLANRPTPLQEFSRLGQAWGGPRIWVKRDDLTGFGLSGNKIRKLEYHLSAALADNAQVVMTCGAVQSNHCRAAALAAARLGLGVILYLRTPDGKPPQTISGNHRLDVMAGAEIRYITPDQYVERDKIMREAADGLRRQGRRPWVIPEGASDGLGMWGMVQAYQEMIEQAQQIGRIAEVWHAASSGGTTAGFAWAAGLSGFEPTLVAVSVGDPSPQLEAKVGRIWDQAEAYQNPPPGPVTKPTLKYLDRYVGGGYGQVSPEQSEVEKQALRLTGLIFDPTYTGKALYALYCEIAAGRFSADDQVIFWHTGGGFAALA